MTTKRQSSIARSLTVLIPAAPYHDAEQIRAAASARHMRHLPPAIALWLATVAYIRHTYTDYDSLRDNGYDRDSARYFVHDAINSKLRAWRATRYLDITDNA